MYADNNPIIRWGAAESERINFVDGNVRPDFQTGKSDEARTYRLKHGSDVIASDGKRGPCLYILSGKTHGLNRRMKADDATKGI